MSDTDIKTYTAFLNQIVPEISVTPENVVEIFMQPQNVAKYLSIVFSPVEFEVPQMTDLSTQTRIDALNELFIQIPQESEQDFALKCTEGLANCDHDSLLDILDMLYYVYDEKQKTTTQNLIVQSDTTNQMIEQLQLKIKYNQDIVGKLENQIKELRNENQQQQHQILQLNNVNKEKQALLQQQSNYQEQIQASKQYISELELKNDELSKQLSTNQANIESIKNQNQQLKTQISEIFFDCFNMQTQTMFDKKSIIQNINIHIQKRIDEEIRKNEGKKIETYNTSIQTDSIQDNKQITELNKQLEAQNHLHQTQLQNIEEFIQQQLNAVLNTLKQELSLELDQIQSVTVITQSEKVVNQKIITQHGQFSSIDEIIGDQIKLQVNQIESQALKQTQKLLETNFKQQLSLQEQKYKQLELQHEQLIISEQNSKTLLDDEIQKTEQMQQKITNLHQQIIKQEEQLDKLSKKIQKYKDVEKKYKNKELKSETQNQMQENTGQEKFQSFEQQQLQNKTLMTILQELLKITEKIDDNQHIVSQITNSMEKCAEQKEANQAFQILLDIITQISHNFLASQRRSKQNNEKNDTIRELKSLLYQLQEQLLKEIFLRIKAQFSKENQREIRITFNEVNVLAKLEEVSKNQYEQFIQKIFNSMLIEEQWQKYNQKLASVNQWIANGKMHMSVQ